MATHSSILGASQVVLVVKNSPVNAGYIRDVGLIPGLGRSPWRRAQQPTSVFLNGEFHGQRSLVGYSPWGHKESDTTDQLTISLSLSYMWIIYPYTSYIHDTYM